MENKLNLTSEKELEKELEKKNAADAAFFKQESVTIRKNLISVLQELIAGSKETMLSMQKEAGTAEVIDSASIESARLLNLRFRDRERKLIKKINKALRRLNEQQYHLCENCEELIGRARLLAKPTAALCVKCQQSMEQEKFVRQL